MKKNYNQMVQQLLEAVGGNENVSFVTHCVTRLRMNIRDRSLMDIDKLNEIDGVINSQWSGEQFQIIIGQAVADVYDVFCKVGGFEKQDSIDENLDEEKKIFSVQKLVDALSGSVAPLIPALIGCGLIKIILMVIDLTHAMPSDAATYQVLSMVADAGFYFLPVFMGYSAAVKFKANPILGALMGAVLIHPTFIALNNEGVALSFFGLPIAANSYANMIFPTLITVYVMSKIEHLIAKYSPEAIRSITEPFFTILIMIPIMLCATAPVGIFVGNIVIGVIGWLYNTLGFIGVAVLAGVFPFLILTGTHTCAGVYALQSFMSIGYDPFVVICNFCCNLAIGGACVGAALKTKNVKTKSLGLSFAFTTFLSGVCEPALFGMCTKYKSVMLSTVIGSVAGGIVAGVLKVGTYAFPGSCGFFGMPCFIDPTGKNLIYAFIAVIVSTVVGCIASFITFKED